MTGHSRWADVKARHQALVARREAHEALRALDPAAVAKAREQAAERREYLAAHGMVDAERQVSAHAWHGVIVSAFEETCRCGQPATHKVGDQSGPVGFHELTAYLCCGCMRTAGMDCVLYPPH